VKIRNHTLVIDEPESNGGKDSGPTPIELLAASLASCTAITMQLYAERKGWDLGDIETECDFTPAKRGVPSNAEMRITIPRKLTDEQLEKLRVVAAKCPVHRALEGEVMFNESIETSSV